MNGVLTPPDDVILTRSYQQEMLDDSLRRNIIIALDTGSGKTHIAVLRLRYEMDNEPSKVCPHDPVLATSGSISDLNRFLGSLPQQWHCADSRNPFSKHTFLSLWGGYQALTNQTNGRMLPSGARFCEPTVSWSRPLRSSWMPFVTVTFHWGRI
jgi:hypothetical protein